MQAIKLKLANLRALQEAEFSFKPGFNLIVGINGVGKTSVVDALGVCLSAVVNRANNLKGRVESFTQSDIRVGSSFLSVECAVGIGDKVYTYLIHKPRERSVAQAIGAGKPREQVLDTPEKADFVGDAPQPQTAEALGSCPLAMLFSTRRAIPSEKAPSAASAAAGTKAAYADAFANRELQLGRFADWMKARLAMLLEIGTADTTLSAIEAAVSRFLPKYRNLRLGGDDERQLIIDRDAMAIPVRYLSDGERGALSIVLDIAQRLAQANPELSDPVAEAEAVVLIDEIDLHLHPKWQRQIVRNLVTTFPRCQFIATTHSPQIIGEVENDRIQIIADGQVYTPTHSYGVDSSRLLEEVMGTNPRAEEVHALLKDISQAIGRQDFRYSHELVSRLVDRLGENDPEVTRIRTLLSFLEGEE